MNLKKRTWPVLTCLFLTLQIQVYFQGCICEAASDPDPLKKHLASLKESTFVTEAVFKNGLKVLINEHRAHPVVSIQFIVKTGIADDPPESPGLLSLMSEMFFRRTDESEIGTPEQNARMIGGFHSSFPDRRLCRFEVQAPAQQWKKALQVQYQAISNSKYDPDQVENTAAWLHGEALRRLEPPLEAAREKLFELVDRPYVPGQWASVLKGEKVGLSSNALSGLHNRMFVPENMLLVFSGDVNAMEVLNETARLFGDLPAGGFTRDTKIRPKVQKKFRYARLNGNYRNSSILFGFQMPGIGSSDYPALEVLNAMLGIGNASILAGRLDNQKHILLDAATDLRFDLESGYISIQATVPPENIDRGELAILVELELLKRKAPEAADMERAWAQLERTYRENLQTVSGRAWMLAQSELQGDWRRIDRHISELRRVKAADIRRVAEKYFNLKNCTLIECLPATSDSRNRTLKSVQGTLEALLVPATDEVQVEREKEVGYPVDIPKRDDAYRFSWIQYPFRIASVLRGPEIYIREDHTTPLIHLGFFYPGGILHEGAGQSGITSLMVPLMLRGTLKQDPYSFNRQLEVYGGRILPVVEDDFFGFYFSIPSINFRTGFDLLAELIKSPAFNKEDVDWQKSVLEAKRRRYREDRAKIYMALLPDLFSHFPYSRDQLGSSESLADIDEDALKGWFELHVKNRKPVVVIVGDSEGTSLASYFVRDFSGSRFGETDPPEEFIPVPDTKKMIEDGWDKDRSLVSLGFQAPPIGDPDLPATTAFRNYLDWKVQTKLRDEDFAVDTGIEYEPKLRGGSFIGYAIVEPGTETKNLERLGLEFQKSVAGTYSYRDFRSAVNGAVGRFRIRQQEPLNQIKDVTLTVLADEGIEGYRSFLSKLQAVREQDIKYAADRIINMERAVSLRLYGDKSAENISVPEKPVSLED